MRAPRDSSQISPRFVWATGIHSRRPMFTRPSTPIARAAATCATSWMKTARTLVTATSTVLIESQGSTKKSRLSGK